MNPILLKPERRPALASRVSEGRVWDDVDAWEYHRRRTDELFPLRRRRVRAAAPRAAS